MASWSALSWRVNPTKLAVVALANKTARIVWAVMMRGDGYQPKEVFWAAGIGPTSPFSMRG